MGATVVHLAQMTTAADVAAALASLAALIVAALLAVFAGEYYGSAFYGSAWPILAGAAIALMLVPLIVGGLALFGRMRSRPDLPIHRRICGICGLLIGLIALPAVIVDNDWALAGAIVVAGALVASPWLIGRLSA